LKSIEKYMAAFEIEMATGFKFEMFANINVL